MIDVGKINLAFSLRKLGGPWLMESDLQAKEMG